MAQDIAIEALNLLFQKFSPGTAENADEFYSTTQISKAITEHTGLSLTHEAIAIELQKQGFTYDLYNHDGMQFCWLMKRKANQVNS
jgi:DUF2075 family protein